MSGTDLEFDAVFDASEVIRALSPRVLATLLVIRGQEQQTQREIGERIGTARSTVSKYLQTLGDLPVALIQKSGHTFTVTQRGEEVLSVYDSRLNSLGVDLQKIDWNTTDIKDVEQALAPLFQFRSVGPFLILNSIDKLLHEDPADDSIWMDDLIIEMKSVQEQTGATISKPHFEQIVEKLEKNQTITRDGDELALTQKGEEQVRLLGEIAQVIEKRIYQSTDEMSAEGYSASTGSNQDLAPSAPSTDSPVSTSVANQNSANAFDGVSGDHKISSPELGPVVCIETEGGRQTIGPIRGRTASDLATQFRKLATKLDEVEQSEDQAVEAGIYRALITDTDTIPLGDDWQPLYQASHTEWGIIDQAHRIVGQGDGHDDKI